MKINKINTTVEAIHRGAIITRDKDITLTTTAITKEITDPSKEITKQNKTNYHLITRVSN